MNKNKTWIWITISVLVIAIVIFIVASNNYNNISKDEAVVPSLTFQGTVVSVPQDNSSASIDSYELVNIAQEIQNGTINKTYPNYEATIKIDKIISSGGSYEYNWSQWGIKQGKEIKFFFKQTTKPINVTISTVESKTYPGLVNGTEVHEILSNGNNVTISLPGLRAGSKFEATVYESFPPLMNPNVIGEYKLISY